MINARKKKMLINYLQILIEFKTMYYPVKYRGIVID